jgi:transcription antitermination factor NusG
MSATFTAYPSDIQPATQERTEFVQGRFGATYTAFVEATVDIKEGDQVKIIGGTYANKVFSVKGVSHWEGAGLLDHTELVLTSQDG